MFLFFTFCCVYALIHFIFESILAPSIRLNLRFDLFSLRDKLRRLKAENPELSDEAFSVVQDGLNGTLKYLYEIDVPVLLHCDSQVKADPILRERMEKRREIVKQANSEELISIVKQLRKKVESAAIINSGGWLFYVVPMAVLFLVCKTVFKAIFSFVYLTNHELGKIMPEKDLELSPAS